MLTGTVQQEHGSFGGGERGALSLHWVDGAPGPDERPDARELLESTWLAR